jgi:hypothetical protein
MVNKEFKKYLIALKKNLFKDLDIFFASIPNEILAKKDFIEYAIQITPKAYIYASQEIRENKEILLKVLEDGELDTVYIPDSLINDKEVLESVVQNESYCKHLFSKLDFNQEVNKTYAIESIKKDINRFNYIPDNLKNDRNYFLRAVKINGSVMHYANDTFKDDEEIVTEAVKTDGNALINASKRLQNNKEIALTAVKVAAAEFNDTYRIFYSISELRSDKELIIEALKNGSRFGFFELISDELKNNIDFAIEALKLNPKIIENEKFINTYITNTNFITYLLNKLNNNYNGTYSLIPKTIVSKNSKNIEIILSTLEVIKNQSTNYSQETFQFIDQNIKNDIEFFKRAVAINGLFLEFSNVIIKNHYEVVLEAVKENGIAIYFASEELQKNETLINIAINNGAGTKILTKDLSTKENLTLALLSLPDIDKKNAYQRYYSYYSCSVSNASPTLKDDRDFCLIAVKSDGKNIQYISERLLGDPELVDEAFINSRGLDLFSYDHRLSIFRDNKDLVLKLIKTGARPLENVSINLKDDLDIVISAVSNDGLQLKFASERLKENQEIVLKAIEMDSENFQFASIKLKSDVEFISKIIRNTKYYIRGRTSPFIIAKNPDDYKFLANLEKIFKYCSEKILSNKELMIEALKQEGSLLAFASEALKSDKEIVLTALQNRPTKDILMLASKKLQDDLDLLILTLK